MWKYDLQDTFPLLTTRRQFTRAIFEELIYLSGKTDNKILTDKNIHIWDGNTHVSFWTKEVFNDIRKGDMGETYGFNIRYFGGEYIDCKSDYTGVGYDQLDNLVNLLKNDQKKNDYYSESLCVMRQINKLYLYQFYVTKNRQLNVMINLRSSDYCQ